MSNVMIVGIDGSDPGERAAEFAANVASAQGASLIIVYVIEWSPYTFNTPEENEMRHKRREEEIESANINVLTPMLYKLRADEREIEGMVLHGHPARTINRIARDNGASQIFVGRTGGSGISKLIFGSVASNLVQTAAVPVTVIP